MKYLDSFLDNWLLPLSLALVSGWILLRQKAVFMEHKDMLKRINELEKNEIAVETKLKHISETQSSIRISVEKTLETVTQIRIDQASNKNKEFLQQKR